MKTVLIASIMLSFVFISCVQKQANKIPSSTPIVGTWKYVSDQLLDTGGQVIRQDTDVDGLLIYTDQGKMSMQFYWRGSRSHILNDSIMNYNGKSTGLGMGENSWPLDITRKLIDTYKAYFGDYVYDPVKHHVVHTNLGNIRPEKEGIQYERNVIIQGDSLYLSNVDTAERWRAVCVRVK